MTETVLPRTHTHNWQDSMIQSQITLSSNWTHLFTFPPMKSSSYCGLSLMKPVAPSPDEVAFPCCARRRWTNEAKIPVGWLRPAALVLPSMSLLEVLPPTGWNVGTSTGAVTQASALNRSCGGNDVLLRTLLPPLPFGDGATILELLTVSALDVVAACDRTACSGSSSAWGEGARTRLPAFSSLSNVACCFLLLPRASVSKPRSMQSGQNHDPRGIAWRPTQE